VTEWIIKQDPSMCCLKERDSFQTSKCLQIESKRMEKYLSCKWMSKESQDGNTYIGQSRLFFKDFIYLFERERESISMGSGRGRGRSGLPSEQGAQCGAPSQDHDRS